jgi:hypothetical protein
MATLKSQVFLALFAIAIVSNISHAAHIACDIDVSNSQAQLLIEPSNDVYSFAKIDLLGGFRVSAQYLSALNKFKLYVYTHSKRRYVLLNTQEFALSLDSCSRDFGRSHIYGEPYERELFVKCYQVCGDSR